MGGCWGYFFLGNLFLFTSFFETDSRANEVCRDYKRGYCPRGERCYFQHVATQHAHSENELATPGLFIRVEMSE